jgi:hypothetical protein
LVERDAGPDHRNRENHEEGWACPGLADTNGALRTMLEENYLTRSSVSEWVRTADRRRAGAERSTFRWDDGSGKCERTPRGDSEVRSSLVLEDAQ